MDFSLFFQREFDDTWANLEPLLQNDPQVYREQFNAGPIRESLIRIENAQDEEDRETWSREWARQLSDPTNEEAWQLNYDRKLLLQFLYRIIDMQVMADIDKDEITRIVRPCLVMDRANALYNMIDSRMNRRGLHWYARIDEDRMFALIDEGERIHLRHPQHRPPLNRRLRALRDNYEDDEEICRWMDPHPRVDM